MGKRYYCDYCDRSFIDDVESRKKHLNSVNHMRNRKAHYAINRDLITLIEEESKKDDCKRFRNTGYCPFENMCNFTHYSKEELIALKYEVEKQKSAKVNEANLPDIQDWLTKRNRGEVKSENAQSYIPFSTEIHNLAALPPSLQPVSVHQMINAEFDSWG